MPNADLPSKQTKSQRLCIQHLDACIELDQLALNGLWTNKQWEQELIGNNRMCFGIINHSKLLAFACGWIVVDEIQLTAIGVHPLYRQKGLAKKVVLKLLDQAFKAGARIASLEVSSKNFEAIALYKSLGFKHKGIRQKYYRDGSDALLQYLYLNDRPY